MIFVLDIRVLTSMQALHFEIPVDLVSPATLRIRTGDFGTGNRISIMAGNGETEPREWFAQEILGLRFEAVS